MARCVPFLRVRGALGDTSASEKPSMARHHCSLGLHAAIHGTRPDLQGELYSRAL